MTIAVLRSLHAILGDAIDDIERVYASHGQTAVVPDSINTSESPDSSSSPRNLSCENSETIPRPEPKYSTALSYSQAYASPPPSPSVATNSHYTATSTATHASSADRPAVDFPSLDLPCDPSSLSETLTTHPTVLDAIGRIVAAAGQLSATVQVPFLTICDSVMGYHLQSCMRLLEASHVPEILREAGPNGLHVDDISRKNGVHAAKLAHILRLLAAHHMLREVSPDVFTLNRISSLVDSGKMFSELKEYQEQGIPEKKYSDAGGIAAFVGLCTDEIQKSSAYMTETYYLSSSQDTREGNDPTKAPFCFAFDTLKTRTAFFGWLEGETETKDELTDRDHRVEIGRGGSFPPTLGALRDYSFDLEDRLTPAPTRSVLRASRIRKSSSSPLSGSSTDSDSLATVKSVQSKAKHKANSNKFRLERFGKAMSGSEGWEAPGAILNGFDWQALPPSSTIVDVGGGIGSTSMLLATAFSSERTEEGLRMRFIIQDRPVVCEMGNKAWQAKCPELLDSGAARFQVHDFFTPQPIRNAAVFLLRCVLHDWPNGFARQILLHLREAATPETRLVIADFILPLACPDDVTSNAGLGGVEGAESLLPPAPLLPNLGKANANVYWMDLTMQVMFNSQERTLREMVNLTSSAGWKIIKATKTPGSSLGYLIAVPVSIPPDAEEIRNACSPASETGKSLKGETTTRGAVGIHSRLDKAVDKERRYGDDLEMVERASSRCGTPTFGSNTRLASVQEALARFGGDIVRSKAMGRSFSSPSGTSVSVKPLAPPLALKPALSLVNGNRKKRPSPLSVPPLHSSPSPVLSPSPTLKMSSIPPRGLVRSNAQLQIPVQMRSLSDSPRIVPRRKSFANLRSSQRPSGEDIPPLPTVSTCTRQPPPSPMSPLYTEAPVQTQPRTPIRRRASHAQLHSYTVNPPARPVPPTPSLIPIPVAPVTGSPSRYSGKTSGSPTTQNSIAYQKSPNSLQLPHSSTRKRSGTIAGNLSSSGKETLSGFTGGGGHVRQMSLSATSQTSSYMNPRSPAIRGASTLAAAAKIDDEKLLQRPPSP